VIKEELIYSDYEVYEIAESKIDPAREIRKLVGFKCPKCKRVYKFEILHKQTYKCWCGLHMKRVGNVLICEISDVMERLGG
jgi:PHP family Zn ribbon phosphoesterase